MTVERILMKAKTLVTLFVCLAVVVSLAVLAGCGSAKSDDEGDEAEQPWVQTELYFGRGIPSGGEVTEEAFSQFLEEIVTKEFPAGLTVFDAYGQQQDKGAPITRQKTKVVLLVHQKTQSNAEAVERVIAAYRQRFGNPQVMHAQQAVEPEFFAAGGE
jgi:Protein of unknown function (DUF3574)